MKKVGLTGGIGAGKTTVARIFSSLGVPVYDADTRARELVVENSELQKQIIQLLGENSYVNGEYNRPYVAQHVFGHPEKLEQLNALIHPAVGTDFTEWASKQTGNPYLIKEAALMFESGSNKGLDAVICVDAPELVRIARVKNRDPQRSEKEIRNILDRQMSQSEKVAASDFVIQNDGNSLLIPQVLAFHRSFLS